MMRWECDKMVQSLMLYAHALVHELSMRTRGHKEHDVSREQWSMDESVSID